MMRNGCRAERRSFPVSWEPLSLRGRCVEPEGDTTVVIPNPLLRALLEATAANVPVAAAGSAPRLEIVELPDDERTDASHDAEDFAEDDAALEGAFRNIVGG